MPALLRAHPQRKLAHTALEVDRFSMWSFFETCTIGLRLAGFLVPHDQSDGLLHSLYDPCATYAAIFAPGARHTVVIRPSTQ